MSEDAAGRVPIGRSSALVWASCAILLCSGFATIALILFPELGFAKNPTGEFHPEMFWFAGLVGLGLGLGQVIAFLWAHALSIWRLVLWVALTTVAVAGMIFPLWWVDAEVFFLAPWYAVMLMSPGLTALALAQGMLLHSKVGWVRWFIATILGGAVGAVGGLFVAAMLVWLLPFEAVWAGIVAAAMAIFQRKPLADLLG